MPESLRSEELTARVGAIDLCYQTFGDASHPAVLLIMGLGTQMLAWDVDFCDALAARGFFVVRFDNRDIGRSTWLDHEDAPSILAVFMKAKMGFAPKVPYTLGDMAADAIGLLDVLGIRRAHVVGASMGGMIGQEMAMRHAGRLLSFTSIMSSTGNPKLPGPTNEAAALLMRPPVKSVDEFVAGYPRMLRVLRAGEFPEDEAKDAERAAATWARGYHPAGSARQFAAIVASGDRTERLKAVTVPTLVIHGRADPLTPVDGGIATAEAIPGAKLVVIERMGHAMPRAFWPELLDAIAGHARAHAGSDAPAAADVVVAG